MEVLLGYLIIGLTAASFTMGMLWTRTGLGCQRGRLLLICTGILIGWPGIGLLALFDRNLTMRDYINSWLFPSPRDE